MEQPTLPPYDRHVGRYSPALAAAFVRVAGTGRGQRALDVGCGTGALARVLAARLGPERVAAVDPSPAAVEACVRALPQADVCLASAERLPFRTAEFDAVLAQLVVDKLDGPSALREMRRVARPGGVVAACVWDFEAGMPLLRSFWDAALTVDPVGALAAGASERPPFTRPHELHALWSGAGIEAVGVGEIHVAADYGDIDDAWWSFAAGVGSSGAYCASLDRPTRAALKADFHRRLGSPAAAFRLSARAWYVRGTAPSLPGRGPARTRRPSGHNHHASQGGTMLRIGDTAPDFEADTTEGRIRFHDWIGDSWTVLFSHPKDFTPVCTTELGHMAKAKPEFDRRNVKIIGLSVDPTANHARWADDIADTQGHAPNYPLIGDADFQVSKLYGMLPADVAGDPLARTPADNQTVRNVFVIGPDKRIKLILVYPMTTGRNFDEVLRVIDSMQLTAKHRVATPVNWQQGEDVIIAGSVSDDEAREIYPDGWQAPRPYIRIVPQPQ